MNMIVGVLIFIAGVLISFGSPSNSSFAGGIFLCAAEFLHAFLTK